MMALLFDHLWQSSIFAGGAGLITLALGWNSANARFWLWFAASVKFLVPFAALTAASAYFLTAITPPIQTPALMRMQPVAQPFSGAISAAAAPDLSIFFLALWGLGFAVVAGRWLLRWSRLRRVMRTAVDAQMTGSVAVKFAPSGIGPGLMGIWRPIIVLPQGIRERLSREEVDAIMAHELCHFHRRDNLLAATHMLVEALFWFYPVVWWLGARLNAERERACDESVLASGKLPEVYAESILKVCKLYLQSPLDCAAGVSGANLKNRMERIMKNASVYRLNGVRKFLLAASAVAVILVPIALGLLGSPAAMAQPEAQVNKPHFAIRVVDETVTKDTLQAPKGDDRVGIAKPDKDMSGALWLKRAGQIDGDALAEAYVSTGRDGKPVIEFRLTQSGASQFAEMTRNNVGHRLAVVVNDAVITAPTVRTPILGGKGQLTGDFTTKAEANALADEMMGATHSVKH